jgi:hypothetical protein
MTGSAGWIFAVAIVLWFVAAQRFSHRRRLHLRNYVVYLLLNDTIRNDHREKFEEWIRTSGARDAMQLGVRACNTIESMAESLDKHTVLGAHSTLWNSDAATDLRRAYEQIGTSVRKPGSKF